MAVARCTNPDCGHEWPISTQLLGRKTRCKVCGQEFDVVGAKSSSSAVKQTRPEAPPSTPISVFARPVRVKHAEAKSSSLWLLVAAGAFLLPVVAAGGIVGLLWRSSPPSTLCAGIDVSSSGVTYTVFEVVPHRKRGYDYRVLLTETRATSLKKGMDKSGQFDSAGVTQTAEAIRTCCASLIEKSHLISNQIYIVGSGGLMGSIREHRTWPAGKKIKLITENQSVLGRAVENAVGKKIEFLEPSQEAEYYRDYGPVAWMMAYVAKQAGWKR
jgi:hypothetical protein